MKLIVGEEWGEADLGVGILNEESCGCDVGECTKMRVWVDVHGCNIGLLCGVGKLCWQ